ncbi:WRKY transcription factor 22-like isoform X2 [Syzygium oleosum]|uniref:WRKY transcription factor 22-like isoform X2 n=1 Tax=Syzygium oleosum TaxID=219896 RepID=UPI0024BB3B7D|nr:WRKY transcription factor 22-like isoform X2 [Syzygium oleosum]
MDVSSIYAAADPPLSSPPLSLSPQQKSAPSFVSSLRLSPPCNSSSDSRSSARLPWWLLLSVRRFPSELPVSGTAERALQGALGEAMEVDWDLHAVVRGCTASSSSSAAAATSWVTEHRLEPASCTPFPALGGSDPEPFEAGRGVFLEELHELYKPFLPAYEPLFSHRDNPVSSPLAVEGGKSSSSAHLMQKRPFQGASAIAPPAPFKASSHAPRSKKRKSQMKVVRQVPAEKVSSDEWAWRKYGQKPIKGSPYPRCSSSKGCLARKQVERNRSDPEIFIVTYTSEHNHPAPTHRSSLAGSTRPKTSTPEAEASVDSAATATTNPVTSAEEEAVLVPQSTSSESGEEKEYSQSSSMQDNDGEDESGSSGAALSDDFFVGLEGLLGSHYGDSSPDPSQPWFGFSWSAGDAVTAAGGS